MMVEFWHSAMVIVHLAVQSYLPQPHAAIPLEYCILVGGSPIGLLWVKKHFLAGGGAEAPLPE